MRKFNYKKIIIIGCPGSGKSTFARRLRDITDLPLYYLDMIWHKADKTTISEEDFDNRLDEIIKGDKWIIDGNYKRTIEKRLKKCQCVFWLDYPTELCLESAINRLGIQREDMPWNDELEPDFIQYIKDFKTQQNPIIENLLKDKKYADKKVVIFHSRDEADLFINENF